MEPLIARVADRYAVVVPFRPRPKPKSSHTVEIGGRHYVLSTDGGPLGDSADPMDHGMMGHGEGEEGHAKLIQTPPIENKWRFLWAYCTESKQLAMWRVTDGNEKHFGPATEEQARIVRLERRGELNRITASELRTIELDMRRREDELLHDLKHTLELSKTDFARDVDKLAQEFFNHHVKAKLDKAVADVHHGVTPLGFKAFGPHADDPEVKLRQMVSFVLGQIFRREMSADKFEVFIRQKGIDPEAEDPQTIQWALDDVLEGLYEKYLPHYHRPHMAALTTDERRGLETALDFCRSQPMSACTGEDNVDDILGDNPATVAKVAARHRAILTREACRELDATRKHR